MPEVEESRSDGAEADSRQEIEEIAHGADTFWGRWPTPDQSWPALQVSFFQIGACAFV